MDVNEARDDGKLAQSYLDRARELRPMLAAAGDAIERGREVTPEIVDSMIERGIFRMLLPRSIGGAELDPLSYTAVLESLAQGDGSTAWCLGQNSGCSMIAAYLAPEIAREIFGGPHGILAWGRTAGRASAPCCSRNPRRGSSTTGTSWDCAAPAATAMRSRIISCRRP